MTPAASIDSRVFKLRLRFRLRTLLVLAAIFALACSWGRRLHERARAIELLDQWNLKTSWSQSTDFDYFPLSLLPRVICRRLWDCCPRYECLDSKSEASCLPEPLFAPPDSLEEPIRRKFDNPPLAERKRIVAAIASLPELEYILIRLELDEDDLQTLSPLADLKVLGFKTRRVTDIRISQILRHRQLITLALGFDGLDGASAENLAKLSQLPKLERLYLTGSVSSSAAQRIRSALPGVQVEID